MLKTGILLGFLAAGFTVFAQNKKQINAMPSAECPKSADGIIAYSETVSSWMSDTVLYKRAFHWFEHADKTMRIHTDKTKSPGIVTGKAEFDVFRSGDKDKLGPKAARVKFTMTAELSKGQYIVTITRINIQAAVYTPIEKWEKEQSADFEAKFALIQVEAKARELLANFKELVAVER